MKIKQITPIMIVREIESHLPFWENMGFKCVADVQHEGKLGFVMLVNENAHVMLQSEASAIADLKVKSYVKAGDVVQYIDIDSITEAEKFIKAMNAKILVGPRTTDYGAKEIFVLIEDKFVIGFAEHN